MSILGIAKPGPELGQAVAAVMEWQLANPHGVAQDCQRFIVEKWGRN